MNKTKKELLLEIKILKLEKQILELKLEAKNPPLNITYTPIKLPEPITYPTWNPHYPTWATVTAGTPITKAIPAAYVPS